MSKKLVIGIDGTTHNFQKERDALRSHIMNALGIQESDLIMKK